MSFSIDKYIEKLSQSDPRTGIGPLGKSKEKPFDPRALLDLFQHNIHMLGELADRNQRRVEKLEHVCAKQENEHNGRIGELEGTYQVSSQSLSAYLSFYSLSLQCLSPSLPLLFSLSLHSLFLLPSLPPSLFRSLSLRPFTVPPFLPLSLSLSIRKRFKSFRVLKIASHT